MVMVTVTSPTGQTEPIHLRCSTGYAVGSSCLCPTNNHILSRMSDLYTEPPRSANYSSTFGYMHTCEYHFESRGRKENEVAKGVEESAEHSTRAYKYIETNGVKSSIPDQKLDG